MSCDIARFTITRNTDNTFVFTIKANGSTLPMVIEVGDTFQATIINLDTDTTFIDKPVVVTDAANGQITLTLTQAEIFNIISDKGNKTDRYYLRPVYKLLIDCVTVNNGNFIAKVEEIYVD